MAQRKLKREAADFQKRIAEEAAKLMAEHKRLKKKKRKFNFRKCYILIWNPLDEPDSVIIKFC